jgi:hypothetical protein
VRLPPRAPGDLRPRALLLVLPDGDTGTSTALLTKGALPISSEIRDDLVFALLAYRGTPLDVEGQPFTSDAEQSPYDFDTDDALAFLGFVRSLGLSVLVDRERVGVLGVGRGGGTALLTEPRTDAYDVVVDLAGPTDLFHESFQDTVTALLQGRDGGDFPGIEALAEEIVYPLRDSTLTIAQARFALLLRSPRYFAAVPPFAAVVHATGDFVVPVAHSRVLDLDPGGGPTDEPTWIYLELEEEDHTSFLDQQSVILLVTESLREYLAL